MVSGKRLPVFHSLYGLRIAANIPVPGLPVQCEFGQIDVRIHLKDQHTPAFVFSASQCDYFYPDTKSKSDDVCTLRVGMLPGGCFGFFYCDGARFAVERQGREIWADWPDDYTHEDACTYLIGPVIAFVLRLRGVTCLHASSIAVDRQAIVLMGVPGAGKSTTAAAFAQLDYSVLSDDVVVLDHKEDQILVQPGYPRTNLWPDSVCMLFGAEDALPFVTPTWGKRYLPLGQEGRQFQPTRLPLGAIYVLGERQANLTIPVVEELVGHEAFATLVTNTTVNYLLDREMRSLEFYVLGRLLAEVPVRRVRPTSNPSKLFELCEIIAKDARQIMVGARQT
jgi:hypothetical protein